MNFLADYRYYFFLIKLVVVYLVFGSFIYSAIDRYLKKTENKLFLYFSSIGLSLYLLTWFLNIIWVFDVRWGDIYYLNLLLIFMLLFFVVSLKNYHSFFHDLRGSLPKVNKLVLLSMFLLGLLFFIGWSYYIYKKNITEHDTLEYAVQGTIFFRDKCITFGPVRYDKESFFYYVGLHGFSFPLIRTFEMLTNQWLDSGDLFFRSVNSIYGGLILMLVFAYFSQITSIRYSILIVVLFLLNYGFFETIMKYHIDNYRVFFLMASVGLMSGLLKNYDNRLASVWGIFLGAQSNIHSLGFMVAMIQLFVFFICSGQVFRQKFISVFYVFLVMMVLGGWHYIVDVFWGTGWIFKDIKFY